MEDKELELDSESKRNLVGLFDLLYKIDKRNNPELYKNQQKKVSGEYEVTYVQKEPEDNMWDNRPIPALEAIFEQAIKTVIARRDKKQNDYK